MPYKRKHQHKCDKHLKKGWRTRRRKRDLDQIDDDLKPEKVDQLLNQEVDPDATGGAQHYCVHCARYFINKEAMTEHFRGKPHKRRLKALELEPYTIEEAERAGGLGSYHAAKKRKIETITKDDKKMDLEQEEPQTKQNKTS